MSTTAVVDERRRVQVWLAEHLIIDHIAPNASDGESYAAAMARRFASCRVTNRPYATGEPETAEFATP
jgi:hypothetical protein